MRLPAALLALLSVLSFAQASVFTNPYQINFTEYYKMPDLYNFDAYEKCMETSSDVVPQYCVVNTIIKPDASSELYSYIQTFSEREKQHFRHDKLQRGICMEKCMKLIQSLDDHDDEFFLEEFPMNSKLTFDFIDYPHAREDRLQFNRDVNICINKQLMDNYNLNGFSSIEYCLRHNDRIPLDWLDYSATGVILIWLLLVFLSSTFDAQARIKTANTMHYTTPFKSSADQICAAFSVKRNWYRLISEPRPEHRNLRSINAIKTIVMFLITNGHVFWYILTMPMTNPEFIEKHYHNPFAMIMINGENLPNTFFFFSGFLFCILIDPILKEEKNKSLQLFIKTTVYRCIRLLPVMVAFLLIHSTFLYHLSSGPIWERINFAERQFCRKNWWLNALFLNNFFSGDEKCLVQSWFLSADFHLSIIGLILLIVIAKYPKRKWIVISSALAVSFSAVVVHIYAFQLEPIFVIIPEFLRNQLFLSRENEISYFYLFHSPSHLNAGNYIIGLMFGFIYIDGKDTFKDARKSWKLKVLWNVCWLLSFVISILGFPFIESNIEPSIWTAFYGGFMKNYTGFLVGMFMLGVITRVNESLPKFLNLPMFRVLGRISYSYYLCHIFVMKLFMLGASRPFEISDASVWAMTGAIFFFGNILSIPLALIVEFPVNAIAKEVLKHFDDTKSLKKINFDSVNLTNIETRSK